MQWDIKALREKMADVAAKCEAIFEIAKAENRDLTAEESAEVDKLQGTSDKPGEIQALQSQIARAERFDAIKAANVVAKLGGRLPRDSENAAAGDDPPRIQVPTNAKRSTKLQAFRGPSAMEDAYLSGQFLLATLANNGKAKQWCNDHGVKMIMNTDENGKGGYLVPDPLENTLIDLKEEFGSFRQYSMPWPMTGETTSVPRRVSGFTTYFPGQGKDISLSDMAFDQVKLAAKKLACLTRITSELNEDTIISLADVIAREMAYALAVTEDDCGWLGDGGSTYGGIKGVANALAAGSIVTATGVTTFANVTRSHFQTVVGKLPGFRGIQPAWYMNKAAYWATAANLQLAAGGNAVADLGSGPVLQFMGYPVRLIESLPGVEGSGVKFAYFGDLAMTATMGNRRGVEIRSDSSVGFVSDTIYIRCTERFDINVHEVGTATKAGPLVMLQLG
jgi:HK97 family phage major capsid protein